MQKSNSVMKWGRALIGLSISFSAFQAQAQNIDLGEPSVLSQQGQRLKIAVPFGSNPGEDVPLLRFQVLEVQAGNNERAPLAKGFTISKPEKRNVVYLQSHEVVNASQVKLVLAMAGNPAKRMEIDVNVPPASATEPVVDAMASKVAPKAKAKKKAKSKSKGKSKGKLASTTQKR
jgi:hypothetical protein